MAIFKLCIDCKELLTDLNEAVSRSEISSNDWVNFALRRARECLQVQNEMQASFDREGIGRAGPRRQARKGWRPDLDSLTNYEMSYLARRIQDTATLEPLLFSESQKR